MSMWSLRQSMRGELLLETGALVSLLDRSQRHHLKGGRAFADCTGPVVSAEAAWLTLWPMMFSAFRARVPSTGVKKLSSIPPV